MKPVTIDNARKTLSENIDIFRYYTLSEVEEKELLIGVKIRSLQRRCSGKKTEGKKIKFHIDETHKNLITGKRVPQKVFVKGEDLLKYMYNNYSPYIGYTLKERGRNEDYMRLVTGSVNYK